MLEEGREEQRRGRDVVIRYGGYHRHERLAQRGHGSERGG
jgi:hypothetical protein